MTQPRLSIIRRSPIKGRESRARVYNYRRAVLFGVSPRVTNLTFLVSLSRGPTFPARRGPSAKAAFVRNARRRSEDSPLSRILL